MEHKKIVIPSLSFFQNELKGEGVVKSRRTLGELAGIFENQDAYSQLSLDQLAYEVYSYLPGGKALREGFILVLLNYIRERWEMSIS